MDEINKTIEQINKTSTELGKKSNVSLQQLPVINAKNLQTPVAPITSPQVTPSSQASGLVASIEEQAKQSAKSLVDTSKVPEQQKINNSLMSRITGILGGEGEIARTAQEYADSEVDTAQKEVNDITNQINAKNLGYRRQIEKIRENAEGRFGGAVEQEVGRIERQAATELADLSIIQMAKQNNYATAKDIADRKVSAELEGQRNELEALKFWYTDNKDQLDKTEERQFNVMIKERERLLGNEESTKKSINDLTLNALQNGAPTSLVQQAQKAKTLEEATSLIGGYVDSMDRQLKQAQIASVYADLAKKQSELATTVPAEQAQRKIEMVTLANELKKSGATGKGSAVGASFAKFVPFGQALGLQGARTAFESRVNTLKSNLTLDNLKLLKGAMSDKDLLFLNSIGSSLDVNMSEAQFDKELGRVISKLDPDNSISQSIQDTQAEQVVRPEDNEIFNSIVKPVNSGFNPILKLR